MGLVSAASMICGTDALNFFLIHRPHRCAGHLRDAVFGARKTTAVPLMRGPLRSTRRPSRRGRIGES